MDPLAYVHIGYGAPEAQGALAAWLRTQEATLLVRKGILMAPASPQAPAEALVELAQRYYANPSFDTAPALGAAYAQACRAWPGLSEALPALLVLRGRDLVAVGSALATVCIVRNASCRELLTPAPAARSEPADLLRTGVWRLTSGDALLAGERAAVDALRVADLQRVGGRRDAPSVARELARAAGRQLHRAPALAVALMPALSAVPEMPVRPGEAPKAPPVQRPRREGASPIWWALVVATLAIGASLFAQRGQITRESVSRWVKLMFIPAPTPTPTPTPRAEPTATPEFSLAAPRLVSPAEGESASGEVTLRWEWAGALPEGARYEVRLWRTGLAEERLALTEDMAATVRRRETGWWQWRVQVVQVQGAEIVAPLSPPTPVRSFFWR